MAASLGIAGFGAIASLAVYRTYLIGIALASLAYSYFTTYRRILLNRNPGRGPYRPMREEVLLWATTVLVALVILFPYLLALFQQ